MSNQSKNISDYEKRISGISEGRSGDRHGKDRHGMDRHGMGGGMGRQMGGMGMGMGMGGMGMGMGMGMGFGMDPNELLLRGMEEKMKKVFVDENNKNHYVINDDLDFDSIIS